MRNLVYIEDRIGEVHFFEYVADRGKIEFNGPAAGRATFNRARELLRAWLREHGTDIRVPAGVESAGAENNTYSCFRCSGCHSPVQVVRDRQPGLKRAKHDAADYACLYEPFPPLRPEVFVGIGTSCWGSESCIA
jgi:hypothetical protein